MQRQQPGCLLDDTHVPRFLAFTFLNFFVMQTISGISGFPDLQLRAEHGLYTGYRFLLWRWSVCSLLTVLSVFKNRGRKAFFNRTLFCFFSVLFFLSFALPHFLFRAVPISPTGEGLARACSRFPSYLPLPLAKLPSSPARSNYQRFR
jgi:hypothetical protein